MKRFYLSVIALSVLGIVGVGAQGDIESAAVVETGTIEDFEYLLEPSALLDFLAEPSAGFFLVDARTPAEYADGHIPKSIQIDYRDIGDQPPTDDREALIVIYCQSGNRSGSATKTLTQLGYTHVLNWGTIGNWPYEVVTGSDPE